MSVDELDELGPVDDAVVAFPPGATQFSDEVANELAILADTELIRVLDILIVDKAEDGEIEAHDVVVVRQTSTMNADFRPFRPTKE